MKLRSLAIVSCCLLLPCGIAAAAELARLQLDADKGVKHGATFLPEGVRVEGNAKGVKRFHAGPPHARAVSFGRSTVLRARLDVKKPPTAKGLDPKRWYGVVSVDVLGGVGPGRATLELAVAGGAKGREIAATTLDVERKAVRARGKDPAAPAIDRLWLRIPPERFAALVGSQIDVTLTVKGGRRVVVDELRLDAFHEEPTRGLLGKANGKNGPDVLASGALGFAALTEHFATAFSLLSVDERGPSAKAGLRRSDLVVAVEGRPLRASSLAAGRAWFDGSHEAALGRAVEDALVHGRNAVKISVLRERGVKELAIKLPVRTELGARFPFGDPLVERMREDIVDWVAGRQKKNGFWPGNAAVNSCLAGLCLLGTRERKHRPALRRLVDALLELNPRARDTKGFSYWSIAFQGIFFCEYHLATGDKRVLDWIREAITWLPSTTHECKWGMQAFGHSPKGLPYGKKALMAPCSHLLVFEALAELCGVESGVWKHIKPYVMHSWSDPKKGGHGGMGYNASAKDTSEFWSRTGLTALALDLRGHHKTMRDALTKIMVERHPWMLNSHAYGEPGGALGLVALTRTNPKGFADVMQRWRWRFLNAWKPGYGLRYSTAHMGAPYMGEDEIMNPAYGVVLSVLNRGLVITGGEPERWLR